MLALKSLRMLVVDDNEDAFMLFTLILKSEGVDVIAVSNALQALTALELARSPFDILISDIVPVSMVMR